MENIIEGKKTTFFAQLVSSLGMIVLGGVQDLGEISNFLWTSIKWLPKPPYRFVEIIQQIEFVGNKSVFIIFLQRASFVGSPSKIICSFSSRP